MCYLPCLAPLITDLSELKSDTPCVLRAGTRRQRCFLLYLRWPTLNDHWSEQRLYYCCGLMQVWLKTWSPCSKVLQFAVHLLSRLCVDWLFFRIKMHRWRATSSQEEPVFTPESYAEYKHIVIWSKSCTVAADKACLFYHQIQQLHIFGKVKLVLLIELSLSLALSIKYYKVPWNCISRMCCFPPMNVGFWGGSVYVCLH